MAVKPNNPLAGAAADFAAVGTAYSAQTDAATKAAAAAAAKTRNDAMKVQRAAQQQAVADQNQPSWYNTVLDNFWMDDTQKGLVSDQGFSIYGNQVIGKNSGLAGFSGQVGDRVNAATTGITKGMDAWNKGLSMGVSAIPGGIQTFTWDQAAEISPGQAMWANTSGYAAAGLNALVDVVAQATPNPAGAREGGQRFLGEHMPWASEGFDITDKADREANSASLSGNMGSGLSDAVAAWFLDPLVLGGKAIKVTRYGSDMLGVGGKSRQMTNVKQSQEFTAEVNGARAHLADPENMPRTIANDRADFMVKADYTEMQNWKLLTAKDQYGISNPHADLIAGIGAEVTTHEDALTVLAALGGDPVEIGRLQQTYTSAFDALSRAHATADPYESLIHTAPMGPWSPAVLADTLEAHVDGMKLLDDLTNRSYALKDALGIIDEGARLTAIGTKSQTGAKIAQAWRAGRAQRDVKYYEGRRNAGIANPNTGRWNSRTNSTKSVDVDKMLAAGRIDAAEAARLNASQALLDRTGPAAYERIFQTSAAFRKVRVWSWLQGSHASGFIDVNGISVGTSSIELRAALSDSKMVRTDPAFVNAQMQVWATARNATERMAAVQRIERNVTARLARQYNVDPKVMDDLYNLIDARRKATIDTFRGRGTNKSRAYGVDPTDGSLITLDPVFRSQLETKMPMLDLGMLEKTAKLAGQPQYRQNLVMTNETGKRMLDEAASLWKASVLLRLGYTQRNVAEGWLRSAAVLGTVPALTGAPRGVARVAWTNRGFSGRGRQAKVIAARQASVSDTLSQTQSLRMSAEETMRGLTDQVTREGVDVVYTTRRENAIDALQQQIDRLRATEDSLGRRAVNLAEARAKTGKRRIGDRGAFEGENGGLYRDLASADQTMRNFLESEWARSADHAALDSQRWVKVQPTDATYYTQLAGAAKQMRNDEAALIALRGGSVEDVAAFMRSEAGRGYRRDMGLTSREIEGRAALVHDMAHEYFPTPAARAMVAHKAGVKGGALPSPEDLKALLAGSGEALSPVHGKEVAARLGQSINPVRSSTNFLFKILGSIPETRLVRQPFYNEVWSRQVMKQSAVAASRGLDITDAAVVKTIERSAHAYALKATNDTLYTITRYSNPAAALRFIAPFYPAWENSMKVWLGIIARDPSVAVHASMMWQIPNKMGLVVDKDGNPIESDPFAFGTGSVDRYILMPQALHDGFAKAADMLGDAPIVGGIAKGAAALPLKIPQGSFNVVSPGQTPWLPGFGPLVVAPAGVYLASKPDQQAFLKRVLGDAVYQQIAPFGVASGDLTDTVLPPAWRKEWQRWQGENDSSYLAVVDGMMQTAMVDWNRSGSNPEDKPSVDEIRQKANDFFRFSAIASLTLPVSVTRMSKYQLEIDDWNEIKAMGGMTYPQMIDAFLTKHGESYLPLVTSSSGSAAKNLDPTIETFNVMNDNRGLVESLGELGIDAIGIIGASAQQGQFDQGTYQYWLTQDVPGAPGQGYKGTLSGGEMQAKIDLSGAWRDYNAAKTERDEALLARGGLSMMANANADIRAQWTSFTDVWMVDKYGANWTVAFNDFQSNQGKYLEGVSKVLSDPGFTAKDTPMWQSIRTYMEVRQDAANAVAAGEDPALVSDQFEAWAGEFRFSSLEFADFWDNYLANDNISIGVSPVG